MKVGKGARNAEKRVAEKGRTQEVENALLRDYPAAQYTLTQFISEHLSDCSRTFGGDLQEALVLAIVGQALLDSMRPGRPENARQSVIASRIADLTGMPRQTVRRKLLSLQEKGWIEQAEDLSWRISMRDGEAEAKYALADLDRRAMSRLARLFSQLEQIAPPASGTNPRKP